MITRFIASGFGSGYLPYMPGTWGSVVGAFLGIFLLQFYGLSGLIWATVISFGLGWMVSHVLVIQDPDDLDPSYIVIDEIAGVLLCFVLALHWTHELTLDGILFLFFVFRVFDIFKPFPIAFIERQCSQSLRMAGFGIMVDDVLAAIYTVVAYLIYKTVLFL